MRLLRSVLPGVVVAVLLAVQTLIAQQPAVGVFSRIYLGGTGPTNPQIRWGSGAPSGACTGGSFYLQNTGPVWFCLATSDWRQVANTEQVGNDFYATAPAFGAKCDGSTDDTVAIQGAVNAAYLFGTAGHVVLPPGTCNAGPIVVGPITNPWQTSPAGPGALTNVNVSFTSPRSATIGYTAGSSTITWSGGVVTSADIGNYVYYGPFDATYTAVGVSLITQPVYGCTITAILTSTSATCVGTTFNWQVGPALAPTTGSHASLITDDHNFQVNDANDLTSDNVNKSFTFAVPILRAPQDCYTSLPCTNRPGPHTPPLEVYNTPSPCAGLLTDDWQCFNGGNVKLRYYNAVVTSITDTKHGKMTIVGLSPGSNAVSNAPAFPSAGIQAGSFACNQFAPGLADCGLIGQNAHLDDYVDFTSFASYLQATTGAGQFFAYLQPTDTSQRFISLEGASQSATTLNFTGCPATGQWDAACAALIFSRNKYFSWHDMGINNASGSDINDLTQWGAYFGGLPGGGTQALQFDVRQINISGFGVGLQVGDNLGGEASDGDFHLLSTTFCGIGVRIGPGSFNTLDLHFYDYGGGLDKIGMINYSGNVFIDKGSFSFNDIDFVAVGLGTFTLEKMRTEGPGIFLVGADPNSLIQSNTIAEPQGTRAITGDVTATPDNVHTEASVAVSNVSTGVPAGSFYPITFPANMITDADLRKTVVIPGLGAGGNDVVAQIWTVTSTTAGTVLVAVSNSIVSSGTVTVTIYDTNTCDLTFPADAITPGDVGGALALPDATVVGTWSRSVRAIVTSTSSSTAGKCGFYLGSAGAGPVKPGGGTTTDPHMFANIGAYVTDSELSFAGNRWPSGRIWVDVGASGGGGFIDATNNEIFSMTRSPVSYSGTGKYYKLNLNTAAPDISLLPTPSSNLSGDVGIVLPWTLVDNTNQGFIGTISVFSHGNRSNLFAGPVPWSLADGFSNDTVNIDERFQNLETGSVNFDTALNPFVPQVPTAPVSPSQQFSRVKTLSEAGYVNGKNLRMGCTFATSDTVVCPFARNEAWESRRGVSSPTFFDPATRTYGLNVTSGDFSQVDVGKVIVFPALSTTGGDGFGYIVEITSATVIKVRSIAGTQLDFGSGVTTGMATVGLAEPDALWLPVGLTCSANETFYVSAHDASGVTLKSSNASSTATCTLLVVR